MLILLFSVIIKGEVKTILFFWYVYLLVEFFVVRMLVGIVGRTVIFFLSLILLCRLLCLYFILLVDNFIMSLVCKFFIFFFARNLKNRYFLRIFRD